MNITKEQADKVIAALAYAKSRILSEFDDSCIVTAYNIMRGLAEDAEPVKCWCSTCRPITINDMRMVLCPDCGNKRCPKATDHRLACTNSNEPGQAGSRYTSPQAAQTALKSESSAQAAQAPARLPGEGKTIEALAPIQAAQTEAQNGCLSNCRNCQHFRRDTGGHCYMFKEEPQGVCAQFKASWAFW